MSPATSNTEMLIPPDIGLDMARVLNRMLDELREFIESVNGLPDSEVILISLNTVPVGMGNFLGEEQHSPLGSVELKGGRLEGVVRFVLWRANLQAVNNAMLDLQTTLLAATQQLSGRGFLRFNALTSSNPSFESDLDTWGRTADYSLLYEYIYQPTDTAESLITRIPIHADQEIFNSPDRENTLVNDEMSRWDDLTAPILAVRGPASFSRLSVIAFVASAPPTGTVTITRTYEGSTAPIQDYTSLTDFLNALADPVTPERHGRIVFATLADFLSEFTIEGVTMQLGDWNLDSNLDKYHGFNLELNPPLQLYESFDRLEVMYENGSEPFNHVAVTYLKLKN